MSNREAVQGTRMDVAALTSFLHLWPRKRLCFEARQGFLMLLPPSSKRKLRPLGGFLGKVRHAGMVTSRTGEGLLHREAHRVAEAAVPEPLQEEMID
jgi:hypothetical protein